MFFHDLLSALADAGVAYCLVGGVAVNLHGVPRMTYDVDLVVAPTVAALEATEQVLVRLGLKCRLPVQLASFADPEIRRTMREERNLIAVTFTDPSNPLREVDVLVAPPVDPAGLVARAITLRLDDLSVSVASLDDMIALKRAAGRAQDEADLVHLERLKRGTDG